MSDQINSVSQFFMFLNRKFGSAEEAVEEMDRVGGDGNGTLLKREFRSWAAQESELDSVTKSQLNAFWAKLDVVANAKKFKSDDGTTYRNANAISNQEIEIMDKQMKAYGLVETTINEIYGSLDSAFKNLPDVLASVRESVGNNISSYITKNINSLDDTELALKVREFANKAFATTCADKYARKVFNDKITQYNTSQYNYNNSDQKFEDILSTYVHSADLNINNIKSDVDKIVDAYFASAGFGSIPDGMADDTRLSKYIYNDERDGLNGLQIAVISNKIKTAINNSSDNDVKNMSTSFPVDFQNAVGNYLNSELTKTFNEVNKMTNGQLLNGFKASKAYHALEVLANYLDITAPVVKKQGFDVLKSDPSKANFKSDIQSPVGGNQYEFYNNLINQFKDEKFVHLLVQYANMNDSSITNLYEELVRQVADMVASGQIAYSDVTTKLLELIRKNMAELKEVTGYNFSSNSSSASGDVEALYQNCKSINDNNGSVVDLKEAANAFFDACIALGNDELTDKATSNKSGIANVQNKGTIMSAVYEVHNSYLQNVANVNSSEEPNEPTIQLGNGFWGDLPSDKSFDYMNMSQDYTIAPLYTNTDENFDPSKISYSVTGAGADLVDTSNISNNKIRLCSGNKPTGEYNAYVQVIYDGINIGSKKGIKINCIHKIDNIDNVNTKGEIEVGGYSYNSDGGFTDMKTAMTNKVHDVLDYYKNNIGNKHGYTSDEVNKAYTVVKTIYDNLLNNMGCPAYYTNPPSGCTNKGSDFYKYTKSYDTSYTDPYTGEPVSIKLTYGSSAYQGDSKNHWDYYRTPQGNSGLAMVRRKKDCNDRYYGYINTSKIFAYFKKYLTTRSL